MKDLVERLQAENADHLRAIDMMRDQMADNRTALTLANARIARLEEALKFYSDVGDYTAPQTGYVYGGENKLWCDCGGTARAALKGDA